MSTIKISSYVETPPEGHVALRIDNKTFLLYGKTSTGHEFPISGEKKVILGTLNEIRGFKNAGKLVPGKLYAIISGRSNFLSSEIDGTRNEILSSKGIITLTALSSTEFYLTGKLTVNVPDYQLLYIANAIGGTPGEKPVGQWPDEVIWKGKTYKVNTQRRSDYAYDNSTTVNKIFLPEQQDSTPNGGPYNLDPDWYTVKTGGGADANGNSISASFDIEYDIVTDYISRRTDANGNDMIMRKPQYSLNGYYNYFSSSNYVEMFQWGNKNFVGVKIDSAIVSLNILISAGTIIKNSSIKKLSAWLMGCVNTAYNDAVGNDMYEVVKEKNPNELLFPLIDIQDCTDVVYDQSYKQFFKKSNKIYFAQLSSYRNIGRVGQLMNRDVKTANSIAYADARNGFKVYSGIGSESDSIITRSYVSNYAEMPIAISGIINILFPCKVLSLQSNVNVAVSSVNIANIPEYLNIIPVLTIRKSFSLNGSHGDITFNQGSNVKLIGGASAVLASPADYIAFKIVNGVLVETDRYIS